MPKWILILWFFFTKKFFLSKILILAIIDFSGNKKFLLTIWKPLLILLISIFWMLIAALCPIKIDSKEAFWEFKPLIFTGLLIGWIYSSSPILAEPDITVPVTTVPKPLIEKNLSIGNLKIPLLIFWGITCDFSFNNIFNLSKQYLFDFVWFYFD